MCSEKPHVVYVHVSKTGGTSIRKALASACVFRTFGHNLLECVGPREVLVVTARNPYTRVHSLYHYCRGSFARSFPKKMTFEEFCLVYPPPVVRKKRLAKKNELRFAQAVEQLNGFTPDHVIRFESLQEDFDKLCEALDMDLQLEHHNRSDTTPEFSMDLFTPDMLDRINGYFREDFEMFGYTKVRKM